MKKLIQSIIVFLGVFGFFQFVQAGDMQLKLDDGRDVILHDDSTWGFTKFTLSEGDEEDVYFTIQDGRTILLKKDRTWIFTKGQPPEKKSVKNIPGISAIGMATNQSLDIAVQNATAEALKKAAARLEPYVRKDKDTKKYIIPCIKDEIGDAGVEVTYKPSWTATAKVNLDKVQAKKIVDCIELQVEDTPVSK